MYAGVALKRFADVPEVYASRMLIQTLVSERVSRKLQYDKSFLPSPNGRAAKDIAFYYINSCTEQVKGKINQKIRILIKNRQRFPCTLLKKRLFKDRIEDKNIIVAFIKPTPLPSLSFPSLLPFISFSSYSVQSITFI